MPIWRNTTGDGLWGTAGNWLADGSGSGVPDATKDATFDALSPSCTVNAFNRACRNINFTGYANTLTMSFGITVSGNVTFILSQSSRISGTGVLNINANSTITSNGGTWPNGLTFTGIITVTLADNLTVSGTLLTQTNIVTVNSNTINVQGNLTIFSTLIGTATLNINGTGNQTWTGGGGGAPLVLTTNINKASGDLTLTNIVFGSSTLAGTRTLTYVGLGTGSLIATTTSNFFICSIQSNGANWGNISVPAPTGANPQTITLLDDMYVNNITSGGSAFSIFNGFNLYINGNITITSFGFLGTSIFNVVGTGNQTYTAGATAEIGNNFKINKASGNFILNGVVGYGSGTGVNPLLEHINGVVVTTGSTLVINGNCQIKSNVGNPNAIVFNNLGFANQVYTLTLIDNMTINTFAPGGGGQGGQSINGNTLFINGDITIPALGVSQFFTGTTVFNISGTGNQTWSTSFANQFLRNNIVINKTSGTLNLSGPLAWGTSGTSLTYIQGTVNPGTSTFTSANGSIFNLNAVGFNLWNWTPSLGTQTINTQPLVVNSILTLNGTITFAGTAGWTCASLVMTAVGAFTITLQNGVTYTTTTAVQLTGATNTARYTMISDNASFRAIWTVENTATQAITYVNGTRIDSSLGATVWTLGTVSTTAPATLNWNNGSQPSTVGYTFVN